MQWISNGEGGVSPEPRCSRMVPKGAYSCPGSAAAARMAAVGVVLLGAWGSRYHPAANFAWQARAAAGDRKSVV